MKRTLKTITGVLAILLLACLMVMPAAADDYYHGIDLETQWEGTVNGDVYIQLQNTWNSLSNPIDYDEATATFTGIPSGITIEEARLYVIPYVGNMNADYTGTLYVNWTSGATDAVLSDEEPLDLSYDRAGTPNSRSGPTVYSPDYLNYLNRVTSDYVVVYDMTDLISSTSGTAYIRTTNVTGNFDGRIKEAKLIIAYNDGRTNETQYWINEGNDPITKYGNGTWGETLFSTGSVGNFISATLYTDEIASANGVYKWNGDTIIPSTLTSSSYARLNEFSLDSIEDENYFSYNRTGSYFKEAVALLKIAYLN